jgi:class 3 adenylate cyclase/tetratricopeptide (TPR) repeat protein
MKCPRCQAENDDRLKFCEDCGAPLACACPNCGAQVHPGKKFCGECGAVLGSAPSPKPAAPEQYTPKHLGERILNSRSAMEGERKQVTVLFADLKGSMELLADRDPEEARKLLDPVLERMMEAVHHYEGTVNQVMGDGIMALFGAPLAHEDHAVRACYAALRMQDAINRYSDELQRAGAMPVQIRVGLNSGEVVVRSIGSDLHMDYTAVGQTTHLASRIEQLARAGSTLVSGETLGLAESYVQVKPLGKVPVKGLTEPVEVFELIGVGPARSRIQVSAMRGLTKFVGRTAEMEALHRALAQAAQGHGQVVSVVGEPGVGKSRLYYEFTHSHRTQDWLILEASSVSYGKATPYLPAIDLLKGYFRIGERDDERAIREKVTGKLLTLDRALDSIIAPLAALLGLSVPDPAWNGLDPPRRRRETLDALKRLFLREAQAQPLILMFEDLHWIDSETQAFLDSLVDSLRGARVLLLTNFRPEYRNTWGAKNCFTQLRVDVLAPESAEELLASLLGTDSAFQPLKRLLIERTEGNPFFLEESVRTLYETRVLEGTRGAYRLAKPAEAIQVPPTAQALLAARIDRLAPQNKSLLQTAAVIGKDVPYLLLKEIADQSEQDLRQRLAELQAAEFIYETSLYPDLEYTFKHALTHEVAYGSLLQERRRELHGRIVQAIERLYAERLDDQIERLAHHAEHAELWDKALPYLRQAARKASSHWAFREAAAYLERALAAVERLAANDSLAEQEIDIRLELRTALLTSGEWKRTADVLDRAITAATRIGNRRLLGWALAYISHPSMELCNVERALESCGRALELALASGDTLLELISRHNSLVAHYALGNFEQAIAFGRENLNASDEVRADGFSKGVFGVLPHYLTACLAEVGRFTEAVEASERMLHTAKDSGNPSIAAILNINRGFAELRRGDSAASIPWLERSASLCETYVLDIWVPWTASCLGAAYALAGRHDEGIAQAQIAVARADTLKFTLFQPLRVTLLATAYLVARRNKEAQSAAQRALELADRYQERGSGAWAQYLLAESLPDSVRRDVAKATEAYASAMRSAEELGMRPLVAHCHLSLGRANADAGDRKKGREHLTTALSMYREMKMPFWLGKAEFALKDLLAE